MWFPVLVCAIPTYILYSLCNEIKRIYYIKNRDKFQWLLTQLYHTVFLNDLYILVSRTDKFNKILGYANYIPFGCMIMYTYHYFFLQEIYVRLLEQKSLQEDLQELKKKAEKRLQELKKEKRDLTSKMALVKGADAICSKR